MSSESKHDYVKDGKYNKICACVDCKRTYDEWCKKQKEEGCTICKRKRIVLEEVVCEKPITHIHKWGFKREYEGKWEPHRPEERPRHCKNCKKEHKHCDCKDKKDYKKDHKKEDKKDHKKHRSDDSGFSDDY